MTAAELAQKAQSLQELKRMREELEAEITALEDVIKAEMGGSDCIIAGPYKITWKPVESSRMDTKSLQRELPEIASRYMTKYVVRRFCVI